VARHLLGTKGFSDTSLDEVVAEARVTKGALYHHFKGKEDLFFAVYEQVQREVSDKIWIDQHLDPSVQRSAMRDARAVLGWEAVRDMETRYGTVPLRGVLRRAVRQGLIEPVLLRPLALIVMGP
jgi:AcrR family transcriptional regulator